jgi:hypothetical protein
MRERVVAAWLQKTGLGVPHAHDAAAVADLLDLGVEPQVGVAALERPVAEGVDDAMIEGAMPEHGPEVHGRRASSGLRCFGAGSRRVGGVTKTTGSSGSCGGRRQGAHDA